MRIKTGNIKAETVIEEPKVVAFDGKTSRGSKRNKTDKEAVKAMQTVSAYSTDYGLCLGESVINEKTNEIPTVQEMLKVIDVRGAVATWDALNTQRETVAAVIKQGGEYVGALKGNQHSFYKEVSEYFEDEALSEELTNEKNIKRCYMKTVDPEQSGVAIREYYLTENIGWLKDRDKWAGLKAIGCARRTLKKNSGETIVDTRYFISSVANIEVFAKSVRWHWGVENKIHWHLDYTFHDDQNTTIEKNGAQNLQTMKRAVLAILGLVQTFYHLSLKNIRLSLAYSFEEEAEKIFKLLNANGLQKLLLPR
jgi:predicted transposase YbfD/YdcC